MTEQPYAEVGGRLSLSGRNAATKAALPLLATYFADAPTYDLPIQAQVADTELEDLSRYVRMRTAIASADRLERILRRITQMPAFKYQLVQGESIGAVRGKLDMSRYVRMRTSRDVPRRYPIRTLCRSLITPENTLAVWAGRTLSRELALAPTAMLPPRAPERGAIARRRAALDHLLAESNLAEAREAASKVCRRAEKVALFERVTQRVRGGHISRPEAYADLLAFLEADARGTGAAPGATEWAFYDERFDPKLFELWCLSLLLGVLNERLGPPVVGPAPMFEHLVGPVGIWRGAGAIVKVFYQASLQRSGLGSPQWAFTLPEARPLQGIPDISIAIDWGGTRSVVALLDPKLRIRVGAPTEELYKLLGYFANTSSGQAPLGAIVFYAPGDVRQYQLTDGKGGRVAALGLDPEDAAASARLIGKTLEQAFAAVDIDPVLVAPRGSPDGSDEDLVAVRQRGAVASMQGQAALLPPTTIEPFKREVAALLGESWHVLDDETRRMVATAEYFGMNAPDDADHSGPLLGLAAACERVLHDRLFAPAQTIDRRPLSDILTLGSMLVALSDAVSPSPRTDAGKLLSSVIDRERFDRASLHGLATALRDLNVRYRIPAAHRDLVPQQMWTSGRLAVLRPDVGILTTLVNALSARGPA